jgi:hypothetical protein
VILLTLGAASLTLPGCTGGRGADTGPTTTPNRRWQAYNAERRGWTPRGTGVVVRTVERLRDGLGCAEPKIEVFDSWALTYRRTGLPLPLAAGSCELAGTDESESVLVEVFGSRPPSVDASLRARTEFVCPRVERAIRRYGAPLPGQPYVITTEGAIIQPDRPDTARRVAALFPGSRIGDVCPELSRRFFGTTTRPEPSTATEPGAR